MASESNDACCLISRKKEQQQSEAAEKNSENADQVALITGCASGIGRGTALAFAALNFRLVLVDKQEDKLSETGQLCAKKSSKNYKVSFFYSLSSS